MGVSGTLLGVWWWLLLGRRCMDGHGPCRWVLSAACDGVGWRAPASQTF